MTTETPSVTPTKQAKDRRARSLGPFELPIAKWPALGLGVVCGLLYFLAFPGIDVWPLGFVAWVPVIVALRGQSPRRALAIGWIAGFTMTMVGFYWLLDMLETFSGFGAPLCIVFMAILCGYQAGRIGLMGWLYARAAARGWPAGPVFALAFAASEQVYPLLFPWFYGATVHPVPVLTQIADLGGPIAVGLVLVAANWAIAELVIARLEKRPIRWRIAAACAAVPLVAALYGAVRISQVDRAVARAPKFRAGLVQANMSLMGKRHDPFEGLRRHFTMTRKLEEKGRLDLVVWSETSVAGVVDEDQAADRYRALFTARLGVPAIFGAVLARPVSDVREYVLFNSALLSDGQGSVVGRYDKQFLLAFGEYLPFGEYFPTLYEMSPNSGRFTPGKSLDPLVLGNHRIATFICYEDISSGFVNSIMKHGGADLLVNLTNDAWFGDTTEPWIHLAMAKFRAIEQRRFFVRSTNSGVSAFIDPVGRVLDHTDPFQQQARAAELGWMSGGSLFRVLGNTPWWAATIAALALAFRRRKPGVGVAAAADTAVKPKESSDKTL